MHARSDGCIAASPLLAECMAAKLALSTTHDLGLRCLILEGDSLEVISLLSDPHGDIPWFINSLIYDCINFIMTFTIFRCSHVKRYANSMADHLAKNGVMSKSLGIWPSSPPSWLEVDLNYDVATFV